MLFRSVVHVPHDERVETLVEVYVGKGSARRLVTAIEVLSLSNKIPGEHGRDLYLRKQREVLASKVHLVEIDLLRAGEHTTAVPRDRLLAKVASFDYHVCVHRFDDWEDYLVHAIQLDQPLPTVCIPLLPGDPDVMLNLQAVFRRTYDTGPYPREIHYEEDQPVPPLQPSQAAWADELVRQSSQGAKGEPTSRSGSVS